MTKDGLVDHVMDDVVIGRKDATTAVNAMLAGIGAALQRGAKVQIAGFGIFTVKDTKARKGRNPRTGEAVDIPAKKKITFKPATRLKDLMGQ